MSIRIRGWALSVAVFLAACGGGAPGEVRTVSGTITGLSGSGLTLQLNGGGDLQVPAGADSFRFGTKVIDGSWYEVTVAVPPSNPTQTCSIDKGSGTVHGDVDDVFIVCSTDAFHVGGSVSGLAGTGLVLALNGERLPIANVGPFTFPTAIASGAHFAVTVEAEPPTQTCAVSNGSAIMGQADVTNVAVRCETQTANVWAVGAGGRLLHFKGTAWAPVESGTTRDLNAVWGTSAYDVWAVGAAGTILHSSGGAWAARGTGTTTRNLNGVWGSGVNDVWAVGYEGTILRFTGSSWYPVSSGTTNGLLAVAGTGSTDVWAVGMGGTVLHWNGTGWSPSGPTAGVNDSYWGVWVSQTGDVWIAGYGFSDQGVPHGLVAHRSNGTWSTATTGYLWSAVWGVGPDSVWFFGATGSAWSGANAGGIGRQVSSQLTFSAPSGAPALAGAWGTASNDIWAVGGTSAVHWNGSTWSVVDTGAGGALNAVWCSSVP